MDNQAVRKIGPFSGRQDARQIGFDLHRISLPGKAQSARQTAAVSIDGDTRLTEGVTANHVGGFSADTRELRQILHR
jgi:hypothetical protein